LGADRHGAVGIGQCVGAQNQKFFFIFVAWDALFCLWTFSTILALNVRGATRRGITVDAEQIATIVLYATVLFPLPTRRISQG
jgi:palmitoyltransferase